MVKIKELEMTDSQNKLTLLATFGYQISHETRLRPLLELIAEKVKQILNAERCSVFLYDKIKNELWSQVAHGLEEELRIPANLGIIGYVAQTQTTINVKETATDQRFDPSTDIKTGYKTKTILAMPLRSQESELLGVFEVLNKKHGVFDQEDEGLLQLLGIFASSAIENAQLYEKVRKSHLETIMRLALAIEARDQVDLAGHIKRMSKYAALIAQALGMDADEVEAIEYASPLHDIGKIAIPDRVLLKLGKLTEDEILEMREHPAKGAKILENAESLILRKAYNVAYCHHERYDGTGYPRGLAGEQIPIEARIVALADVFDALTSKRVYKENWDLDQTLNHIRNESGKHFDPAIVDALFKCLPAIQKMVTSIRTD